MVSGQWVNGESINRVTVRMRRQGKPWHGYIPGKDNTYALSVFPEIHNTTEPLNNNMC